MALNYYARQVLDMEIDKAKPAILYRYVDGKIETITGHIIVPSMFTKAHFYFKKDDDQQYAFRVSKKEGEINRYMFWLFKPDADRAYDIFRGFWEVEYDRWINKAKQMHKYHECFLKWWKGESNGN